MTPTNILFLGDSPNLNTGLARIGRDLASLTATLPEFNVAYLGRGGKYNSKLPFQQYNFHESEQWGELQIESVFNDFCGSEKGVIFSIWDASRLNWFGASNTNLPSNLYNFLTSDRIKKWGYFPIDSICVNGSLSFLSTLAIKGYDRVLAYSLYGQEILSHLQPKELNWLPHGINMDIFQPRDKIGARLASGFDKNDIVVGCVMTNQIRKDFGLLFSIMAELNKQNKKFKLWLHTDVLERSHAWSIPSLATDYNVGDWLRVTTGAPYNDTEMSWFYSACDLTLLPSLGEGFGYPIVESLACNVPCITGNYASAPELIANKNNCLVNPTCWRVEGLSNSLRPVYMPENFVQQVNNLLASKNLGNERESIEHLDWKNLWNSCWKKWFLSGLSK